MTAQELQARLATLPRADGSATYAHGGYTVTASANGPIEAQRRDEDPDAANVDVIVRPAAGVGGQPCVSSPSFITPPFASHALAFSLPFPYRLLKHTVFLMKGVQPFYARSTCLLSLGYTYIYRSQ